MGGDRINGHFGLLSTKIQHKCMARIHCSAMHIKKNIVAIRQEHAVSSRPFSRQLISPRTHGLNQKARALNLHNPRGKGWKTHSFRSDVGFTQCHDAENPSKIAGINYPHMVGLGHANPTQHNSALGPCDPATKPRKNSLMCPWLGLWFGFPTDPTDQLADMVYEWNGLVPHRYGAMFITKWDAYPSSSCFGTPKNMKSVCNYYR